MVSRVTLVSLALVVLALAGCGSTKQAATTAATTPSGAPPPAKSASYTVTLAGYKGGSPSGSGHAFISINASTDELCWTFSALQNVTAPTVIRIFHTFKGASGKHGIQL